MVDEYDVALLPKVLYILIRSTREAAHLFGLPNPSSEGSYQVR